jgi:hypothetical protein
MLLEFNLRDIMEPGSYHLLVILKHRATKSIHQQYCEGVNGGLVTEASSPTACESTTFATLTNSNTISRCLSTKINTDSHESY